MPDSQHPINRHFHNFIDHQACLADEIYILGDLFETWVGDDIGLTQYQTEIQRLKKLVQQGTRLYIGFGNRDFLMQHPFWLQTGARKLEDIECLTIQNIKILALHGDLLCTQDVHYQKMRRWFHKPWVQWLFLHFPKKWRLKIADKLRQQSTQSSQQKTDKLMGVSDQAVEALFEDYPQCHLMVHGHTHRPARHDLQIDGRQVTRWVLGDWRPNAKIIKIENGDLELIEY